MQQGPPPQGGQPNPGQPNPGQPNPGQQPYPGQQPFPGQQPPGQFPPQQGQQPPYGQPTGQYQQGQYPPQQGQQPPYGQPTGQYQQGQYPQGQYQNPGYQGQLYQYPGRPGGQPPLRSRGWSKRAIAIVTASCVVVAAAIVVTVVLLNRGPDTSSPQATAEAFVAAINDRDADDMSDLVCAKDREAAQKYQTGGAATDASGSSVHATLESVDQDGDSATMKVSMTMTASGSTAGTSVPVTLPMQHTDGQWLVCGITEAGSVPGGGTLPGGGSLPSNVPGGLPSNLPSNLPGGLPSGLPTNLPTDAPTAGNSAPSSPQTGSPQAGEAGSDPDRSDASAVAHAWADQVNAYNVEGINALMCPKARAEVDDIEALKTAGTTIDVLGVETAGSIGEIVAVWHNVPSSDSNDTENDTIEMHKDDSGWLVCPSNS